MIRETWAEVDLSRLRANLKTIRSWIGSESFFCPMVKANAYGHGDVEVARVCEDYTNNGVGVMLVEEGLRLRESQIGGKIIVFDKLTREGFRICQDQGLSPVIHSFEQLAQLDAVSFKGEIHLEINTGMNRLGANPAEVDQIRRHVGGQSAYSMASVFTHLAFGENLESLTRQAQLFQQCAAPFEGIPKHIFNTPGLISAKTHNLNLDPNFDLGLDCRIGGGLYGLTPSRENIALSPVMTLKSTVCHIQRLEKGESLSYNETWTATRPTVIGVIPVGYADGYPRSLSNLAEVELRGKKAPVRGLVCMDFTMIDVTPVSDVSLGDEVRLFGDGQISAVSLSDVDQTSPYEITTRISSRVPRVYLESK